ncbi:MAG: DUF3095 domain-containing protein [Saprospiraceae bacterium]|nr:DUF3095 domain-containing protein [Saprospiraceae bacterium]
MQSHRSFYHDLPILNVPLSELLLEEDRFQEVPESWHILVTDIRNSTLAVREGRHELVNLIATGSIVAALNLGQKLELEIPFFFGGDGATLLVPEELLTLCLTALYRHQQNTSTNFNLDLRVGHIAVNDIYKQGQTLKLAKAKINAFLHIPIILGNGLRYAENQIKAINDIEDQEGFLKGNEPLDLSGMECRWDRIKPPRERQEVLSILIDAVSEESQSEAFSKVLGAVEEIYGPISSRNPISLERLKLGTDLRRIKAEMLSRRGEYDWIYLVKNWIFTLIGKVYYGLERNSKRYLENLVLLSDTLVMDGRINTVISGTRGQCDELIAILEEMENNGKIIFGWYSSPESIMSCYVRNRNDQHIHFVDGSEGGYTQAAKMLKEKMIRP